MNCASLTKQFSPSSTSCEPQLDSMATSFPLRGKGLPGHCREPSLRILGPGSQPNRTSNKSLNFPKPSRWALEKVGVKSGTLTVSPLTDSPRKERDDRKENCQKWAELEPGPEVLIHTHTILERRLWEGLAGGRTHCPPGQASEADQFSSGDQGPGEVRPAGVERSSHEYS